MNIQQSEITSLLQDGKHGSALKLLIKQAINVGKKHPSREQYAKLFLKVIYNVKSSDIEAIVNTLDLDEIDVLMRYIYYGFEHPTEGSSSCLLTWHDKACNRGGVGSIVRVLTEH